MNNDYYYFWNINYYDYPEICSKKFDDYVERSKMNTYSKTFVLKWIVVTFYDDQ